MSDSGSRPFRSAARARANLRVRLSGVDDAEEVSGWAVTRDVSRGGAFLRCEEPLAPGTRLRLTLEGDAGEEDLELEAEVRWAAPERAPEAGVGVAFLEPPAAVRRRLDRLESQGELAVLEIYDAPSEPEGS